MSEQPVKKQKLEGEDQLSKIFGELEEVQESLEKLNEASAEEILQIDKKYAGKKRPHYQRRSDIVKKIPDFWTTAFSQHPAFAELVSEEDQSIFGYLEELQVEDIDVPEKQGYRISMKFKPNPFFNNTTLLKEYIVNNEGQLTANITEIKWKDAKKKGERDGTLFSTLFRNLGDGEDEVAEIVHEDLWPNAVKYFQGLVEGDESFEGEDFEEGDEDAEDAEDAEEPEEEGTVNK